MEEGSGSESISRRDVLAGLLEEIAAEPVLDDEKFLRFREVLAMGPLDGLLEQADEELSQYYVIWRSSRNMLAVKGGQLPQAEEVELFRDDLRLLGRALRAGIREFDSWDELRGRLGEDL
jgi:hypothetical protein